MAIGLYHIALDFSPGHLVGRPAVRAELRGRMEGFGTFALMRVADFPAHRFMPGAHWSQDNRGCIMGIVLGYDLRALQVRARIHDVIDQAGPWLERVRIGGGAESTFDTFMFEVPDYRWPARAEEVKQMAREILAQRCFGRAKNVLPAVSLSTLREREAIDTLIHETQLEEVLA